MSFYKQNPTDLIFNDIKYTTLDFNFLKEYLLENPEIFDKLIIELRKEKIKNIKK